MIKETIPFHDFVPRPTHAKIFGELSHALPTCEDTRTCNEHRAHEDSGEEDGSPPRSAGLVRQAAR